MQFQGTPSEMAECKAECKSKADTSSLAPTLDPIEPLGVGDADWAGDTVERVAFIY